MALQSQTMRVAVEGGEVAVYLDGDPAGETLLCLNGGPGVSCQSMREAFAPLLRPGLRVAFHDQLGTGASDRPSDPKLWTLRRYVAEVDAVRAAIGRDRVHLLGHSWGGWLAVEYAVTHPDRLKSAVFSSTGANMPAHIAELRRLLSAFGEETLAMIDRIEQAGDLSSPLYRAICTLFYARHSSRRAYEANRNLERSPVNRQIQEMLWGPAEFRCTGEMARWDRLADLQRVRAPSLVLVGAHDYLTPASAKLLAGALLKVRLHVFPDSAHAPYLDEPQSYFGLIADFIQTNA